MIHNKIMEVEQIKDKVIEYYKLRFLLKNKFNTIKNINNN